MSTPSLADAMLAQTTPSPAPPALGPWLTVAEAARRSGRDEGAIRRACAARYAAQGLARQDRAGDGRLRWLVREDADAAYARVRMPDEIPCDLAGVHRDDRETALARKRILDRWDAACRAAYRDGVDRVAATDAFVVSLAAEGRRVSRGTLYAWQHRYRERGLAGLVPGYRAANRPSDGGAASDDAFLAEARRLYLGRPPKSKRVCFELASKLASDRGWPRCSYRTVARHLASIPGGVVAKLRHGDAAYVDRAEPYIERDYGTLRSNEIWCADHHQLDVVVDEKGRFARPWVTAYQDVRSRKIVGWAVYAHAPNTPTILSALRHAVTRWGVPEAIYVDNGKDYDSRVLNGRSKAERQSRQTVRVSDDAHGVWPALGVEVIHCWPYHGQSKPIERWFGYLEGRTTVWDTYCGRSPAHRPENHADALAAGKAPTLAEFAAWLDEFIDGYNSAHAHTGDGMDGRTPDQVYAACLTEKRVAPAGLLDVLLLAPTKPVRVGQNGVRYAGLHYGQHEPALQRMLGKHVTLRVDDRDLSRVQVYSREGDEFICVASANERLPFRATDAQLREALAAKRAARETIRAYHGARLRMSDDLPSVLVEQAAARAAAAKPAESSPALVAVRSRLTRQLPAIRRAMEQPVLRTPEGEEQAQPSLRIESYTPQTYVEEPASVSSLDIIHYRPRAERREAAGG